MSQQLKDELLWKVAKKRASFKRSLIAYTIVNLFLWCVWFFSDNRPEEYFVPWPLWPMLGWGIGLTFQFFGAYVFHDKTSSIEREYEKLKQKNS